MSTRRYLHTIMDVRGTSVQKIQLLENSFTLNNFSIGFFFFF